MPNFIKSFSFAIAYKTLANDLVYMFEFESSPRNQKIKEILNQTIEISNPYSNLFYNEKRCPSLKYLKDELKLYFSGSNCLKEFGKASKFWEKISNDKKTVNSAYGYLLFKKLSSHGLTQWQWAKQSLLSDLETRQAILHFNDSDHQYSGNLDFPCTIYGIFNIRKNKLNFTVSMRANDLVRGISYDVPFFLLLMQCMLLELRESYPNIELGNYTHFVNSMHLYERDFGIIVESLNYSFDPVKVPQITVSPILNLDNSEFKESEFGHWLLS